LIQPTNFTIELFALGKDVAFFIVPFFKFIEVAFELFTDTAFAGLASLHFLGSLAVLYLGLRELFLELFDAFVELNLVTMVGSIIGLLNFCGDFRNDGVGLDVDVGAMSAPIRSHEFLILRLEFSSRIVGYVLGRLVRSIHSLLTLSCVGSLSLLIRSGHTPVIWSSFIFHLLFRLLLPLLLFWISLFFISLFCLL